MLLLDLSVTLPYFCYITIIIIIFVVWNTYFFLCGTTEFRDYCCRFVLHRFCSFVHTRPNISERFQRRDWIPFKSGIFCNKLSTYKRCEEKVGRGKLHSRSGKNEKSLLIHKHRHRKQWDYLFPQSLSFLRFSCFRNNKCMWIQKWAVMKWKDDEVLFQCN